MRVLVCSVPQAGHFNPMVPLIRELHGHGDVVLVATGPPLAEQVQALGVDFQAAGGSMDSWFERLRARTRGMPGDGLPPERISHYFVPRLFAEIAADDMVDELLEAAKGFRPDLVVHDAAAFAGPLVADILGVRSAQHLFGACVERDVLGLASDALSPLWRTFDRDVPPFGGVYRDLTIAICPSSLDPVEPAGGELLRVRPAPLPLRPPEPQTPPVVYFTLGTLWANRDVIATVLDAIADEPVEVVLTTGQLDPSELGAVPANTTVARHIPQEELLPRCAAVIHHAGAGTMFGALAHGLPQVALPQAADNFVNAAALHQAGAAELVMPGELDCERVRSAVRRVLTQPDRRTAAETISAEIATMPAPAELVDQLHRITSAR